MPQRLQAGLILQPLVGDSQQVLNGRPGLAEVVVRQRPLLLRFAKRRNRSLAFNIGANKSDRRQSQPHQDRQHHRCRRAERQLVPPNQFSRSDTSNWEAGR